MKLSVLTSTINDGIFNISSILLDRRIDVEYIVSHQYTEEKYKIIPEGLQRDDVIISQISGIGLAKSRNNALNHATGDIGLISDDDVKFKNKYFDTIIESYQKNKAEVICFKIKTPDGEDNYKLYPNNLIEIKDFTSYSPSSIEITFLMDSIKRYNINFDERFGLGAKFIGGEEKIFLKDCIDNGMKVIFNPHYIIEHPYESSNKDLSPADEKVIRKNAAEDCRMNGGIALIKSILGPIKNLPMLIKKGINPFSYFYYRFSSVLYILMTNKKERD